MSKKLTADSILPFIHPTTREIETEDVLLILRNTYQRASSPVVRECLQEACAEIAYLTSSEGSFEEYLAREGQDEEANQGKRHGLERDAI